MLGVESQQQQAATPLTTDTTTPVSSSCSNTDSTAATRAGDADTITTANASTLTSAAASFHIAPAATAADTTVAADAADVDMAAATAATDDVHTVVSHAPPLNDLGFLCSNSSAFVFPTLVPGRALRCSPLSFASHTLQAAVLTWLSGALPAEIVGERGEFCRVLMVEGVVVARRRATAAVAAGAQAQQQRLIDLSSTKESLGGGVSEFSLSSAAASLPMAATQHDVSSSSSATTAADAASLPVATARFALRHIHRTLLGYALVTDDAVRLTGWLGRGHSHITRGQDLVRASLDGHTVATAIRVGAPACALLLRERVNTRTDTKCKIVGAGLHFNASTHAHLIRCSGLTVGQLMAIGGARQIAALLCSGAIRLDDPFPCHHAALSAEAVVPAAAAAAAVPAASHAGGFDLNSAIASAAAANDAAGEEAGATNTDGATVTGVLPSGLQLDGAAWALPRAYEWELTDADVDRVINATSTSKAVGSAATAAMRMVHSHESRSSWWWRRVIGGRLHSNVQTTPATTAATAFTEDEREQLGGSRRAVLPVSVPSDSNSYEAGMTGDSSSSSSSGDSHSSSSDSHSAAAAASLYGALPQLGGVTGIHIDEFDFYTDLAFKSGDACVGAGSGSLSNMGRGSKSYLDSGGQSSLVGDATSDTGSGSAPVDSLQRDARLRLANSGSAAASPLGLMMGLSGQAEGTLAYLSGYHPATSSDERVERREVDEFGRCVMFDAMHALPVPADYTFEVPAAAPTVIDAAASEDAMAVGTASDADATTTTAAAAVGLSQTGGHHSVPAVRQVTLRLILTVRAALMQRGILEAVEDELARAKKAVKECA